MGRGEGNQVVIEEVERFALDTHIDYDPLLKARHFARNAADHLRLGANKWEEAIWEMRAPAFISALEEDSLPPFVIDLLERISAIRHDKNGLTKPQFAARQRIYSRVIPLNSAIEKKLTRGAYGFGMDTSCELLRKALIEKDDIALFNFVKEGLTQEVEHALAARTADELLLLTKPNLFNTLFPKPVSVGKGSRGLQNIISEEMREAYGGGMSWKLPTRDGFASSLCDAYWITCHKCGSDKYMPERFKALLARDYAHAAPFKMIQEKAILLSKSANEVIQSIN
jgi:hypothetical protein